MRLVATMLMGILLAGCLSGGYEDTDEVPEPIGSLDVRETGPCFTRDDGPPPPKGEDVVGLQPIQMIFGGTIRHADTRVLLIPPTHGDLGNPTNDSRSGLAYLEATLAGIFAWEPTIERFVAEYPQFSYLENITVQVEIFEEEIPETAGYDIVIGYAETSGPVFRGVAIYPGFDPQPAIEQLGMGDVVHFSNRYILLSLFAYSERAGQSLPDFPETHEVRGVTMHEFAHTWGLGHTTTWTPGCGGDLMNSPYPYVYGDGHPIGDENERSRELCITTLDMYGLAHLYRWLPNGTWQRTDGEVELPEWMVYKDYCDVMDEAQARAKAVIAKAIEDRVSTVVELL